MPLLCLCWDAESLFPPPEKPDEGLESPTRPPSPHDKGPTEPSVDFAAEEPTTIPGPAATAFPAVVEEKPLEEAEKLEEPEHSPVSGGPQAIPEPPQPIVWPPPQAPEIPGPSVEELTPEVSVSTYFRTTRLLLRPKLT